MQPLNVENVLEEGVKGGTHVQELVRKYRSDHNFCAVLASISGIFPGFLTEGELLSDSWLPEGVARAEYTTYAFVAIGIALAVGIIFYIVDGSRLSWLRREQTVLVEQEFESDVQPRGERPHASDRKQCTRHEGLSTRRDVADL